MLWGGGVEKVNKSGVSEIESSRTDVGQDVGHPWHVEMLGLESVLSLD